MVSFLITGIEFDSISYKNIKIDKLYIKYDEKLIFNAANIAVYNQQRTKKTDMKLKFYVQKIFSNYHIKVEEYYLKDPHLKAYGDIIVKLSDLNPLGESNLYINNFRLQFSKKLKFVTADKCYVKYKKGSFYFSFKDPVYEGVGLNGSEVAILDYEKLKLDLHSKDRIKKPLLELLKHYKIDLPITQENGTNDIYNLFNDPF